MRPIKFIFFFIFSLIAWTGMSHPAHAGETDFEVDLFAVDSDGEPLDGTETINLCISETCSGSDAGTCLISEDETATFEGGVYETTVDLSSLAATPPDALCFWVTFSDRSEILTPLKLGSVIWARWAEVAGSVASGSISASSLATDAVTTTKILDGTIAAADIASDAVEAAEIATGAVTTTEILDGTIAAGDMATGAVTTTVILDGTIAAADIASDAVEAAEIATGAVTTTEILDGTIAAADIASSAVTSAKILDGTIAAADLDHTMTQTWTGAHTFSSTLTVGGASTFDTDVDLNLAATENLTLTSTTATADAVTLTVSTSTANVDGLRVSYSGSTSSASASDANYGLIVDATFSGSDTDLTEIGSKVSFTNNSTAGAQYPFVVFTSNGSRNSTDVLALFLNNDTGGAVTDCVAIESEATGSSCTDGLSIGKGTETITNAIHIASTGVTNDIVLQNGETIDNNTDGEIGFSGAILANFMPRLTNKTSSYNVTSADTNTVFHTTGTGNSTITFTLPSAAAGLIYTFVAGHTNGAGAEVVIDPNDGVDIIKCCGASAGDSITNPNGAAGDNITLMAVDTTNWIVLSSTDTWTDTN